MVYLEKFVLPIDKEEYIIRQRAVDNGAANPYIDNIYPCQLFSIKSLQQIDFDTVTIFYGNNGSGKSTLLNLIAKKLLLNRIAPYNSSELFDMYVDNCDFQMGYDEEGFIHKTPNGSRIISSDDIFDYMLTVRTNNKEIEEKTEIAKEEWAAIKFADTVKFTGLEDYEKLRVQVLARQKSLSRRKFIRKVVGQQVKLDSNGETALSYFQQKIKNDVLYCLDEPENSLSPIFQQKLVETLQEKARYCGNQFIIATHSPFILSMNNAKIYDLDANPVDIKKWWELESVKVFFNFFDKHKNLFSKD